MTNEIKNSMYETKQSPIEATDIASNIITATPSLNPWMALSDQRILSFDSSEARGMPRSTSLFQEFIKQIDDDLAILDRVYYQLRTYRNSHSPAISSLPVELLKAIFACLVHEDRPRGPIDTKKLSEFRSPNRTTGEAVRTVQVSATEVLELYMKR